MVNLLCLNDNIIGMEMSDENERRVGTLEHRVGEMDIKVSNLDLKTQILEKDFAELKNTTQKLALSLESINDNLTKVKYAAYGIIGTILANALGVLPVLQKLIGL